MPINLKGRSLLSLDDVSASEIRFLLRLAAELKSAKLSGSEQQRLKGRTACARGQCGLPPPVDRR